MCGLSRWRMKMDLFEKRGQRYHKVAEWIAMDSFPLGATLVEVQRGSQMRTHRIEPDRAAVMVAIREHRQEIIQAIQAIERKPSTGWTAKEWERYRREFGDSLRCIQGVSAAEILDRIETAIARVA